MTSSAPNLCWLHFEYVLHATLALNLKGHFFSLFFRCTKALAIVGKIKLLLSGFILNLSRTQQQFPVPPTLTPTHRQGVRERGRHS